MNCIVLDTNVFVSGIYLAGAPYQILSACHQREIQIVYSREILEEYIRVGHALSNKYKPQTMHVAEMVNLITTYAQLVTPVILDTSFSRDPDDDKFIACALGEDCQLIVSGDKDLLDITGVAGIVVLTPGQFVKIYL